MGRPVIPMVGKKIGRLTVLKHVGFNAHHYALYLCRCKCGTEWNVSSQALRDPRGWTKSCGCWRRDRLRTHGLSKTPEWFAFMRAKSRCVNRKTKDWKNYGGRGIHFLFNDFSQFFKELGKRPKGLLLDRINNDGHYEPGNVQWASRSQSNKNRRPFRRN